MFYLFILSLHTQIAIDSLSTSNLAELAYLWYKADFFLSKHLSTFNFFSHKYECKEELFEQIRDVLENQVNDESLTEAFDVLQSGFSVVPNLRPHLRTRCVNLILSIHPNSNQAQIRAHITPLIEDEQTLLEILDYVYWAKNCTNCSLPRPECLHGRPRNIFQGHAGSETMPDYSRPFWLDRNVGPLYPNVFNCRFENSL